MEAGALPAALRELQAEALAEGKDANLALGVAYDLGMQVPRDAERACHYYSEAGRRGNVSGAFNAAVMHDSGQCGPARQADQAAIWYGRAAVLGAGRAEFNLGLLYASGDGVPHNPAVAASWFQAAAASGITAAAARSSDPPRAGRSQGPLLPVVPTFPGQSETLLPDDAAILVWNAPNEPDHVRFFVELYALTPSGPIELATRTVDVTSVRIVLPPTHADRLTWRVLTVSADPPRYVIGPWRDFIMLPTAPTP